MSIKFNKKTNWTQRLNMMKDLRDNNPIVSGRKYELLMKWSVHAVAQLSFRNPYFCPHAAFGGVGFAQAVWNIGHVRFRYTDYRAQNQHKTMTLDAPEFIRRFLLHVLPSGFHRIRYYGLLGNRHRREHLAQCRHLLGTVALPERVDHAATFADYRDRYEALTGSSLRVCPRCHDGHMRVVERLVGAPDCPRVFDTS